MEGGGEAPITGAGHTIEVNINCKTFHCTDMPFIAQSDSSEMVFGHYSGISYLHVSQPISLHLVSNGRV